MFLNHYYCVEVWGNTHKSNTDPIFILQKRAIRIINKIAYTEPSNPPFIKLKELKFKDPANLKTAQIMYRATNHPLPHSIQGLFQRRESNCDLRETYMFQKHPVGTNAKYHCASTKGVNLWNRCTEEMKTCRTLIKF